MSDVEQLTARVCQLEADVERYAHGKLATRCEVAESELAQLRERVAKAIGYASHVGYDEKRALAMTLEALRGS